MVNTSLALGVLQLVALALPAFAILMEIIARVIMQVALVVIDLGLVGMVVGIGLVGLRTRQAQTAAAD